MSKRAADSPMDNRRKQKKNRLPLSTAQKIELLQKLDSGVSVMRLTVEYSVGTTTIYDLKRQRDRLLEFYAENNDRRLMRSTENPPKAKNEDLDRVLIEWVHQQKRERVPLTNSTLIKQARKYHEELNLQGESEYSEDWLQKFKKRHDVKYLKVTDGKAPIAGETNKVSQRSK